jgi:hemolysin D
LAAARAEAQIQAAKLSETLPLLDEQIAANEQLLAKGYVSKLKVIEMRRQRLSTARDRDAAIETAAKASAQLAGADSNITQGNAAARARVLGDLAKAEADAKLRREELAKATQKSSLQTLSSPVSGTVTQLAIHTIGGVVEATKPVMVIVPDNGTLIAEVKILNKDIGFVRRGQPVAIKLEAFPFTRYGTMIGSIQNVGSDAIDDEKLGLVYPAQIVLERAKRSSNGHLLKGSAGMQVTADIRTDRRSILSYLLSPIDEAAQEAGRER